MLQQKTAYPDPKQLRQFTTEPVPFHELSDIELCDDDRIRCTVGNVEYVFHPTYVLQRENKNEWNKYEYPETPIPRSELFEDAIHTEIQEDYICQTVIVDTEYEVYWVLEEITISNPNLYNE